jgi:hypothetical protein
MGTCYITVKNKSATPIHCAVAASVTNVQQTFYNDVPKEGYFEWPFDDVGWHVFTAVIASEENRFKSEDNGRFDIRRLLAASPLLVVAGPLGWALAAAGTIASVVLDQTGAVPIYTGTLPGVGKVQWTIKAGAKLDLWPIVIPRLYTQHGNDIQITGGDVKYEHDKTTKRYVILSVSPLRAHWNNRMSPKGEADYVASANMPAL